MAVTIPTQSLERLRNLQRTAAQVQGLMQAIVDTLHEAQGQPAGAQIDLERGVWMPPQEAQGAGGEHDDQ